MGKMKIKSRDIAILAVFLFVLKTVPLTITSTSLFNSVLNCSRTYFNIDGASFVHAEATWDINRLHSRFFYLPFCGIYGFRLYR